MPEKSSNQRVKAAKRRGTPLVTRRVEDEGLSAHARKKSRHNGRVEVPEDRHMKRKTAAGLGEKAATLSVRAPGKGKLRAGPKELDFVDAFQARQERIAGKLTRSVVRPAAKRLTTVKGRKKAPSEMGIRRTGGPKNRSGLHGG